MPKRIDGGYVGFATDLEFGKKYASIIYRAFELCNDDFGNKNDNLCTIRQSKV